MMKSITMLTLVSTGFISLAGIQTETFQNGQVSGIRVENGFYWLTIIPELGGRIFQWKNKISGVEVTDAALPRDPEKSRPPDGILDDRGAFWNMKYSCSEVKPDRETVILYFKGFDSVRQLGIERKMIFRAKSPVIHVRYKYENHSSTPIFGFDLGQRNFIRPSGKKVTPDDLYFIPTTHAVRKIKGFTLDGMNVPDLGGKLKTGIGAPWHAFLSRTLKSGIAVHHRDNWYSGWYMWKDNVDYPTYEWMYGDLPAGCSRETAFDLIQVDGFDALSHASPDLLADMRMKCRENQVTITLKTKKMADFPASAVLTTGIRKIASQWSFQATPVPFRKDTFSQILPLNGDGLYEVIQRISVDGKITEEWRDALQCGDDTALEKLWHPVFTQTTEPRPIPGWKAPEKDILAFREEAKLRGFAVSHPKQNGIYTECRELVLKMARNEFESKELVLYGLTPGGDFRADFKAPPGVDLKIVPEETVRLDARSSGMITRYGRILNTGAVLSGEKPSSVWLVFGGDNMKSGKYTFYVTFTNKAGKNEVLKIALEVSPVALPGRKRVMLESEYILPAHIMRNDKLFKSWFANMAEHGVDFFQYGGRGLGVQNIAELDRVLDSAIAVGITRFKAARYDVSTPSTAERNNWKRLAEYLHSKGIQNKDIFVKILDEQPPDKFPQMAETAKWLKEAGFRPFSTFDMLFAYPEQLKILSPYFDMYQGGFVGPLCMEARRKDGLFKAGDLAGNYTGWGTCWQSYEMMMNLGIQTAVLELPFFHNHEYMRGGNSRLIANIIMINRDGVPLDSAAHEGLRDGMEFANLAALCRSWFALLDGKPEFRSLLEQCRSRYKHVFGTIFKKKLFRYGGIEDYRAEPGTVTEYEEARKILLHILEQIKTATAGHDFGRIAWNGIILYDSTSMFQAHGPESAFFTKSFLKRFHLKTGARRKSLEIRFRLTDTGKQSYRIIRGKDGISVEASSVENLRKAGLNWMQTMDADGVWE